MMCVTQQQQHVYRYPVKEYLPLQDPPHLVLKQSAFLVQCMDRLIFYEPPEAVKVVLFVSHDVYRAVAFVTE